MPCQGGSRPPLDLPYHKKYLTFGSIFSNLLTKKKGVQPFEPQILEITGAGGETRTRTGRTPGDFESPASTNSTTPALRRYFSFTAPFLASPKKERSGGMLILLLLY